MKLLIHIDATSLPSSAKIRFSLSLVSKKYGTLGVHKNHEGAKLPAEDHNINLLHSLGSLFIVTARWALSYVNGTCYTKQRSYSFFSNLIADEFNRLRVNQSTSQSTVLNSRSPSPSISIVLPGSQ